MNRMSRRLKIVCIVLALVVLSTTAAYAYFTDYEEAKGGAKISLKGQTEVTEVADNKHKDITVENQDDADMIVRVQVFGEKLEYVPGEGWTDGKDGFWYYDSILKPGESTSTLTVNIPQDIDHDFDVVVVHESSRVVYDGTDENNVVKPDGWVLPDISVGLEEVNN